MHKLDPLYKSYGPKNSSGSFGVTGVKRSFSTKKASSPSEYVALTHDLRTCISLTPSTKVMVLKIHQGSFGGHRGQKVIFTKKASSPSEYVALTHDLRTCISLTPSTKVMVLKIHQGHLGSQGSKGHFHQKGIKSFRIRSIDA